MADKYFSQKTSQKIKRKPPALTHNSEIITPKKVLAAYISHSAP
jgi:hypothetical protein